MLEFLIEITLSVFYVHVQGYCHCTTRSTSVRWPGNYYIISGIVPTVCYFSVFHFIIKTRIAFVKYTVQSRHVMY
jgi:hypothetical protein